MKQWKNRKKYTTKQALILIGKYCAARERSQLEVKQKLRNYGLNQDEADELVIKLIEMNFLSESRFVELYVRSKFNQMGWGKQKIKSGLLAHDIPEKLLSKHLDNIPSETYELKLQTLLAKKLTILNQEEKSLTQLKKKLYNYALQKGYESELIFKALNHLLEV